MVIVRQQNRSWEALMLSAAILFLVVVTFVADGSCCVRSAKGFALLIDNSAHTPIASLANAAR